MLPTLSSYRCQLGRMNRVISEIVCPLAAPTALGHNLLAAQAPTFLRSFAAASPPHLLLATAATSCLPQARGFANGIKILEEHHKAQENRFFSVEDERLIKKMIANHPELCPEVGIDELILEPKTTEEKVKLLFIKNNIPPANQALISDIVALIEGKA
eukprot:TRINITY_DN16733_c1_g2_i1.p1 TRINITY_DN16733_c1_g2~~TRINITY_DN16733_c1_g2_i1.p1  ORF type:complete len:158 (+),score=38.09 TRINITY_DN16733_c1_g2_i1:41-514(+)